jgi:OOP family OmpA-OmpF porin
MILAIVGVLSLLTLPVASAQTQSGEQYTDLRERTYTPEVIKCSLIPEACSQGQAPGQEGEITRSKLVRPPSTPTTSPPTTVSGEPRPVVLNVNFATNSDTILPQYYSDLNKLGEVLSLYPQTRVEIAGYTDSRGSLAYNQSLSERRAESVKRYLVERFSITPAYVGAKGYGPSDPIASNDTSEGREKNRRVQAARVK